MGLFNAHVMHIFGHMVGFLSSPQAGKPNDGLLRRRFSSYHVFTCLLSVLSKDSRNLITETEIRDCGRGLPGALMQGIWVPSEPVVGTGGRCRTAAGL